MIRPTGTSRGRPCFRTSAHPSNQAPRGRGERPWFRGASFEPRHSEGPSGGEPSANMFHLTPRSYDPPPHVTSRRPYFSYHCASGQDGNLRWEASANVRCSGSGHERGRSGSGHEHGRSCSVTRAHVPGPVTSTDVPGPVTSTGVRRRSRARRSCPVTRARRSCSVTSPAFMFGHERAD